MIGRGSTKAFSEVVKNKLSNLQYPPYRKKGSSLVEGAPLNTHTAGYLCSLTLTLHHDYKTNATT